MDEFEFELERERERGFKSEIEPQNIITDFASLGLLVLASVWASLRASVWLGFKFESVRVGF